MTFLILFTASAWAGIIASCHFLTFGRFLVMIFTAPQIKNQLLALHLFFHLFYLFAIMVDLNPENALNNLFANAHHQFHEKVVRLFFVFLFGIFLPIPSHSIPVTQPSLPRTFTGAQRSLKMIPSSLA